MLSALASDNLGGMRHSPILLALALCTTGCDSNGLPVVTSAVVDPRIEKPSLHPDAVLKPTDPSSHAKSRLEKIRLREYKPPERFRTRMGALRVKGIHVNGGNVFSEAAVAAGLKWLALHQTRDGNWSFCDFAEHGRCNCGGPGSIKDDVAATAMALLPFAGAGMAYKAKAPGNKYVKQVDAAVRYLLGKQQKTGAFSSDMYGHALATLVICELFGLSQDAELREPAQKAIGYLVDAQTAAGGWRYQPRAVGYDTSIGVWVLQALKAGEWAGLDVPDKTYENCTKWLDNAGTDAVSYGYAAEALDTRKPPATKRMSAAGMVCRQLLGSQCQGSAPKFADDDVLFNYDSTMRMFQGISVSRAAWDDWNRAMRDSLVRSQDRGPREDGTRGSFRGYVLDAVPVASQHGLVWTGEL